jgi:hypothetical protein
MSITGSDLALTPARSALLRSGAGRSGWPIPVGAVLPLYALSGVMRSGATRSNYHSGQVFVAIDGVHYATGRADEATRIPVDSLQIVDSLHEEPTTGHCTALGFTTVEGQEVVITLGSKNTLEREFGGHIIRQKHFPLTSDQDNPETDAYALALIDYTWGLDKRTVSGYYTGSATTIAESLIATYATGYTAKVEAGLATVTGGITFTNQSLTGALTQLCDRVGAKWLCDYHKAVRVYSEDTGDTEPTVLNSIHPTLRDFSHTRDLSQVVTRVQVEGGGSVALTDVSPGETVIPVATADWYDDAGGVVVSGPQRITYTGRSVGGGGGLVGQGASPSAAPALALATGAGIESGAHGYAVTFVTAAGESLPGPVGSVTVGVTTPPSAAPVAGTATIGTGPDPGSHDYAVTFVTASGETTASPVATRATGLTTAPSTAPTPGTSSAGGSVDAGNHDYAVSFVTSIGETTPSPISAEVVTGGISDSPPGTAPTVGSITSNGGVNVGSHDYVVTFVTSSGETLPGPGSGAASVTAVDGSPGVAIGASATTGGSLVDDGTYYWSVTFYDSIGETSQFGGVSARLGLGNTAADITLPTHSDPRVVGRKLYRSVHTPSGSPSGHFLVATIANNTTTAYKDTTADGSLGAAIPLSNTTGPSTVPLSAIPTGPSGVTSRKLYRRFNGSGTFKLVTTIANNSTTTYNDSTANASLGADAPSGSSTNNTVPLTGIPVGDANVTSRKLYRRSGGAGLKLLATIADNTTTTYSDTTANASLGADPLSVSTAYLQRIPLTSIPTGSALVTSRKIYRTAAGGAQLKLAHTLADNTTTAWTDTVTDASLGANVPVSNTATANQVALSAIPIGVSTVTSRKVYRTAAGASQLKLLATIADNTTTTLADSTADGSLGANVPVSDTSGLAQPEGQVIPGTTVLPVASVAGFRTGGGWAVIGNGEQVIRYTGISGSTLTGIPASGAGAIVAAIGFNSTVTECAVLTGVPATGTGAIRYRILKGEDVNIFVTSNDLTAQATLAALIGGDGIQEYYVQDRRLAKAECLARGAALLELKSPVEVSIDYNSRDINTRSGRTIAVNLGPPFSVTASFLIQTVTQSYQLTQPPTCPRYQVSASSTRLTFEQLLQTAKGK